MNEAMHANQPRSLRLIVMTTPEHPQHQAITARLGALLVWLEGHREWGSWWHAAGDRLPLNVYWGMGTLGQKKQSVHFEAEPNHPPSSPINAWVTDIPHNYEGLQAGPETTLRLVNSLEFVIATAGRWLDLPVSARLPRTRRENEWLSSGGTDPGEARFDVHFPAAPEPTGDREASLALWDMLRGAQHGGRVASPVERAFDELPDAAIPIVVRGVAAVRRLIDTPEWRASLQAQFGEVSEDVIEDSLSWAILQGENFIARASTDPGLLADRFSTLDIEDVGQAGSLVDRLSRRATMAPDA